MKVVEKSIKSKTKSALEICKFKQLVSLKFYPRCRCYSYSPLGHTAHGKRELYDI
jgi:hypothetical protein